MLFPADEVEAHQGGNEDVVQTSVSHTPAEGDGFISDPPAATQTGAVDALMTDYMALVDSYQQQPLRA